jgi:hypothetical protein
VQSTKRLNIAKHKLWFHSAGLLRISGLALILSLPACSLAARISVIKDAPIERLLRDEANRILSVTADAANTTEYQLLLSDFPRADILGMSVGQRRIYISYKLGRRALHSRHHLWLLRQTLAHEIAHELARHADYRHINFNRSSDGYGMTSRDVGLPWYVVFQPYSLEKELQADFDAIQFWKNLQWDCTIWVRILEDFERQDYPGDKSHPTHMRLKQATAACRSA